MGHRATGVIVGVLTLAFLFVFAVNVSLNTSLQTAQVATPPPAQSAWNFDEGSGTTINDSGILGTNDGITGGTTWVSGKNGTGLQFSRSNPVSSSTASFGPITNNFGIANTFSVAFWINPQSTNTGSFVSVLRRGQFVYPFMFSVGNASGGTVQIRSSARAASTNHLVATVSNNTWHHVALVYDGSTHTLYIDGAAVISGALTGVPLLSGSQGTVAGMSFGGTVGFDGILDELKIYNTALTASQVLALYSGTPPPPAIDLTVAKTGTGSGTVTSVPVGINCGADCTETYASTVTSVTLTAAPASGSTFVGWSGICSGTSPSCIVTQTGAVTATAQFDTSGPPPPPPSGNALFIRPVGYRTGCTVAICNGSDWNNAHNGWPSSFVRGVTYYVAEGSYPGPRLDTTISGIQYITIRKATSNNPEVTGAPGWTESLSNGVADAGDPGRVEFTSKINIVTSFWILDGVTGGGPGSWTSGHGFYIKTDTPNPLNARPQGITGTIGSPTNFIEIRHFEIEGGGRDGCPEWEPIDPNCDGANDLIYINDSAQQEHHWTISHSYLHDTGRTILIGRAMSDMLFEYNYFARVESHTDQHSETTSIFIPRSDRNVYRYNIFHDAAGTCVVCTGDADGTQFYGNIVFDTDDFFLWGGGRGNAVVGDWTVEQTSNGRVYNNVFYGLKGANNVVAYRGAGGLAYNNIWYNTPITATQWLNTSHDFNSFFDSGGPFGEINGQASTSDPFVNGSPAVLDFRLRDPNGVTIGTVLGWMNNIDLNGAVRGADSKWDRGAIEFVGSPSPARTLSVAKSGTGSGTVTSNPAGIDCGLDCTENYADGTVVTLTAISNANSTFTGWSDPLCTGTGICTVTMTAAKSVTATFTLSLDTTPPTVSVTAPLNGSIVSGITPVSASASDNVGVVGVQFLLNSAPFGVEDTTSPYSINWDTLISGNGLFTIAARARDVAGNQTTSAPISVTVNNIASFLLSVTKSGSGSGVVTSVPAGISCGADCTENYLDGTSVILTAAPGPGFKFTGWSDPLCPGTGTCTVLMTAAKNITATFGIATLYPLTASTTGAGIGTIFSNPSGISCGIDCSENYEEGTSVILTATPGVDSTFNSWTGSCSGTNSTCLVPMTATSSVTAIFDPIIPPCTLSSALWSQPTAVEGDTVTMNLAGTNCTGEQILYTIYEDDIISNDLIATTTSVNLSEPWQVLYIPDPFPDPDFDPEYYFTAEVMSTGQTLSSKDGGSILDVTQLPPTLFTLMVDTIGSGAGTVTSNPIGIDCGTTTTDCTENYEEGTTVTLTATDGVDSTFSNWLGACAGTSPTCTISMTGLQAVSAWFDFVDATAPTVSMTGPLAGSTVSGTVTVSASAVDAVGVAGVQFLLNGVSLNVEDTISPYTTSWNTLGTADGSAILSARARDGAGNSATATPILVTVSNPFFTLTASTTGAGSGTITSTPAGIDCGLDCTEDYPSGTSVTLTATPNASSTFSDWSDACTGAGTCTVSMTAARSVTATFDPIIPPCTLSSALWSQPTAVEGDTVMMNTVKSNCDSEQLIYTIYESDLIDDNFVATTTNPSWQTLYLPDPFPDPDFNPEYYFTVTVPSTGQVLDSQSFGPLLDVTALPPTLFTLTTILSGTGSGTITSTPTGISCGADCTENYTSGTSVILTATSTPGSTFTGWSDPACLSTGPCTVIMNAARSVGATFTLPSDTTPPTILNVRIFNKTATGFAVAWNTDEATTGGVNYGTTHSYGTYAPDEGSAATDHRVVLDGLARKTTYYFRVTAVDIAGNTTQSNEFSVTTESRLPRPPKVTSVSATEGSVILSWQSPSDYEHLAKTVIYRRADTYTQTPDSEYQVVETSVTSTTWTDVDTQPSTTYYYTLFTVDDESKYSDPEFVSFTTSGPRDGNQGSPRGGGGGGRSSGSSGGVTISNYSQPTTNFSTLLRALAQWLSARRQPALPSPQPVSLGATGTSPIQAFSTSEAIALRERLQAILNVLTQLVQVFSLRSSGTNG